MRPTETPDFNAQRLIRYTFGLSARSRSDDVALSNGYYSAATLKQITLLYDIRLEFVYLFCIEFVCECRRKERTKCGERKDSEKYVVNVDTDDNNTCERMSP